MKNFFIFFVLLFGLKLFACDGCACIPGCGLCKEVYQTYNPNMNEIWTYFLTQDRQTGAVWNELYMIKKDNEKLENEYKKEIEKINLLTQQINIKNKQIVFLIKKINKLKCLNIVTYY